MEDGERERERKKNMRIDFHLNGNEGSNIVGIFFIPSSFSFTISPFQYILPRGEEKKRNKKKIYLMSCRALKIIIAKRTKKKNLKNEKKEKKEEKKMKNFLIHNQFIIFFSFLPIIKYNVET